MNAPALRAVGSHPRGPRHLPEIELDLLANVLSPAPRMKGALAEVSDLLRPEHFFVDTLRVAWTAVLELAEQGVKPSMPALVAWFRDKGKLGTVESTWLDKIPHRSPLPYPERLAKALIAAWKQRELGWRLHEFAKQCEGNEIGSIDEFIATVSASVDELGRADERRGDVTLGDSIRSVMTKVQAVGRPRVGLGMGLRALDKLLVMKPGDLVLVAGRPSMGKSSLAFQAGVHVAEQGVREGRIAGVEVISLEMPHEQLTGRTVCSRARVDVKAFDEGRVRQQEWDPLAQAAIDLTKLPLRMADDNNMTPAMIRGRCRRAAAAFEALGGKLELVVIDYLGLIEMRGITGKKNASEADEIGACSREMKRLARSLNVPVILCAQLNREVEKRGGRPKLSDLRGSGSLEQDADSCVFVHRPEHALGEKCPKELKGIAELIVAKQRNGPTGVARVKFFPRYTTFADLDPRDDAFTEDTEETE